MVYKALSMFSGQRAAAVCELLIAVCLYLYEMEIKFSFKKLIYVFSYMMLFSFVIVFIRIFRETGYQINDFDIFNSMGFLNFLAEWNSTFIIAKVLNFTGAHTMGSSFIYSIVCVIPGVANLDIDPYEVNIYHTLDLYNLGSSIIAELFFDWNYFGLIVFFITGFFIRRLDTNIYMFIKNGMYLKVIYWIPFCSQFFYSIRSSTLGWLRSIVFTYIIISLCEKIFHFVYRGKVE